MFDDWYNDPFFNERQSNPHRDIFSHINETFREFDRHMDNMMHQAFANFGRIPFGIEDDRQSRSHRHEIGMDNSRTSTRHTPQVEEVDDSSDFSQSRASRAPRVEEPDDFSHSSPKPKKDYSVGKYSNTRSNNFSSPFGGNGQSYYYCSSSVSYSNGDGTVSMKRKDMDSTGKTHMAEMRRMGDKTVVYDRKIDSDGKTYDSRKIHGMNEDEVDSFNQKWDSRVREDPFLNRSNRNGLGYAPRKNDSNALGYDSGHHSGSRHGHRH